MSWKYPIGSKTSKRLDRNIILERAIIKLLETRDMSTKELFDNIPGSIDMLYRDFDRSLKLIIKNNKIQVHKTFSKGYRNIYSIVKNKKDL